MKTTNHVHKFEPIYSSINIERTKVDVLFKCWGCGSIREASLTTEEILGD